MGPVPAVEHVKYDDCVKALNSAPVGVGGQMWVSFYQETVHKKTHHDYKQRPPQHTNVVL